MNDLHIIALQKQRNQLKYEAHKDQTEEVWQRYKNSWNQPKKQRKPKYFSTRKHGNQNSLKKSGKPSIEYLTQIKPENKKIQAN